MRRMKEWCQTWRQVPDTLRPRQTRTKKKSERKKSLRRMRGYMVEFAGGDRDGCNDDWGRDGWPVLRAALLRWAASSPLGLLQGLMCAGAGNAAESFSRSASTFLALLMAAGFASVRDGFLLHARRTVEPRPDNRVVLQLQRAGPRVRLMCVLRVSPCSLSFQLFGPCFVRGVLRCSTYLLRLCCVAWALDVSFHLGGSGANMWYVVAEFECRSHVPSSIVHLTSS